MDERLNELERINDRIIAMLATRKDLGRQCRLSIENSRASQARERRAARLENLLRKIDYTIRNEPRQDQREEPRAPRFEENSIVPVSGMEELLTMENMREVYQRERQRVAEETLSRAFRPSVSEMTATAVASSRRVETGIHEGFPSQPYRNFTGSADDFLFLGGLHGQFDSEHDIWNLEMFDELEIDDFSAAWVLHFEGRDNLAEPNRRSRPNCPLCQWVERRGNEEMALLSDAEQPLILEQHRPLLRAHGFIDRHNELVHDAYTLIDEEILRRASQEHTGDRLEGSIRGRNACPVCVHRTYIEGHRHRRRDNFEMLLNNDWALDEENAERLYRDTLRNLNQTEVRINPALYVNEAPIVQHFHGTVTGGVDLTDWGPHTEWVTVSGQGEVNLNRPELPTSAPTVNDADIAREGFTVDEPPF